MGYSYDRTAAEKLGPEEKKGLDWLFHERAKAIESAMSGLGKKLKELDKEFDDKFKHVNRALVHATLAEVDAKNDHGFWRQVEPYYSDEEDVYWVSETSDHF
jgi:hypothetical protein